MSGLSLVKTASTEEERSGFWRLLSIYVVLGLACAYLSQWMPAAEGAKRVMTRIWGPILTDSYPTTGRDRITVMVIDDQDLAAYGEVWPVPLGFHERRLRELLNYQPRAVFFDIIFLDDRKDPDLAGFIDAACAARVAGVPVFVGSFGSAGLTASRTERAMLDRRVEVAGRQLPCIEAAYLNLRIDGYDQSVWEYDLDVPATGGAGARPFPSPAARLYQLDHVLAPAVAAEPMALVWGTASDPRNLEWLNSDVRPGGPGAPCSASWHWTRLSPIGKPSDPLCPYQQQLPVRTLKRVHGLDEDGLADAIRGKYVIYGTHLQSNADVILSPYHGRIPGPFLHAMALDNLLSFDGAPKTGGDFGQPWWGLASLFTVLAVLVISAVIAAKLAFDLPERVRKRVARRLAGWQPGSSRYDNAWQAGMGQLALAFKHGIERLAPHLLLATIYAVVILALVGVSYYWFALGPLVWIEFVLFPIGMEFLHLGDRFDAALKEAMAYLRRARSAVLAAGHAPADSDDEPMQA
ncbi:CHASE2 domain-containing protein [Massilia sp. IC2-477]|uniref:CHASE2 domain-containing protein n=1 Tax=Massilia sp. IC2-477 TaxID=2887198 RepID=UPI001D123688|nr:CHASE2 domain-containing protein [Massilia sp. IC2-477]MCC2956428.1 CHASE2 domain-containing protein [Massilia sp. IC2-477]